jgi:hypothetical protein
MHPSLRVKTVKEISRRNRFIAYMKGKILLPLRKIFTSNLILFIRGFVFLTGVNMRSFDARQGVESRSGVCLQVEHDLNS